VADVIANTIRALDLRVPEIDADQKNALAQARHQLESE
jgi:hypothetical protein